MLRKTSSFSITLAVRFNSKISASNTQKTQNNTNKKNLPKIYILNNYCILFGLVAICLS